MLRNAGRRRSEGSHRTGSATHLVKGLAIVVLLGSLAPITLSAQIPLPTQRTQQRQPQPEDTIPVPPFRVQPPVPPLGALGLSMLVPGWGQSILGRRGTGAFFIFWEGLTLTMTIKSAHQLSYQKRIGAETVEDKRQELQDWIVLLVFNHLLAGTEAFVAAQLWVFPAELESEVLADGSIGLGVKFYWADP